jgi:hypothetical protein
LITVLFERKHSVDGMILNNCRIFFQSGYSEHHAGAGRILKEIIITSLGGLVEATAVRISTERQVVEREALPVAHIIFPEQKSVTSTQPAEYRVK